MSTDPQLVEDDDGGAARALPMPTRPRFQPLRSGLLNLYLYDDQEFWFEDGRLLLRGSNGTGKSRVLALQLPLLFDGRLESRRVEPDGDPAKRMEWHLLMGRRYPDRVGYTWLEFGRILEDGTPAFVTIGMGMRAVQGRGVTGTWFFITSQRVGSDLALTDRHGAPLLRPALQEAVEGHGHVLATAKAYRAEVDRQLFGLGAARYEALLELLIQLRRPQLSRALDEGQLSRALSEALPPLDPGVVRDVTEALGKLERDREELDAARRAAEDVGRFATVHDHYLRLEARRRAAELRTAHARYEEKGRRRLQLQRQLDECGEALATQQAERPPLLSTLEATEGELEGLQASQAMEDQRHLQRLDRELQARSRDLTEATRRADAAEQAQRARDGEYGRAATAHEEADVALRSRCEAVRQEAAAVGLPADAPTALATLCSAASGEQRPRASTAAGLLKTLSKQADRRVDDVKHGLRLQRAEREAAAEAQRRQRTSDAVQQQVDAAVDAQRAALATREQAQDGLLRDYDAWHAGLQELRPTASSELAEAVEAFCGDPSREMPTRAAAAGAHESARRDLLEKRAAQRQVRHGLRARREELAAEVARLSSGLHTLPERLPGRAHGARDGRAGAPLWKVCDFSPALGPAQRAGLEAALEAAGLLDAWVPAEGEVALRTLDDAILLPTGDGAGAHPTLASALTVAIDPEDAGAATLDPARVLRVLHAVGFGDAADAAGVGAATDTPWVDAEGRYRLGPLTGRHAKASAAHIGHGAREQARKAALAAATAELTALDAQLDEAEQGLESLAQRLDLADRERGAVPAGDSLRRAVHAEAGAEREVAALRLRLSAETDALTDAREAWQRSEHALAEAAEALALGAHLSDLEALRSRVADLRHAVPLLRVAIEKEDSQHLALDGASARLDEARATQAALQEAAETLGREVVRREQELTALRATVGADVQAVLAQITACETRQREAKRAIAALDDATRRTELAAAELRVRLQELAPALQEDQLHRDGAADAFKRLCATGLLAHLAGDLEVWSDGESWSPTRSVEVARGVEKVLAEVPMDPAACERARNAVQGAITELRASLGAHQLDPRLEERQGVFVILTPLRGKDHSPTELRDHFSAEVETRARVLQEEERRVIENHVVDQLAGHMQERLREAQETAQRIGSELRERPLHTGMRIDLKWEPQPELGDALQRVRKLLYSAGSVWTLEQRAEVADFLRRRIEEAREDGARGGGEDDALQRALDYRRWHRFVILREQEGRWERLTKRTHGTGSGGEKAVALTLPQLAAASAHYQSAAPHAPRVILMDEVFVGVDSDMRSKCMGLLAAFDLDMMLTSEREWGCYPTVPSLSICQLATLPGVDAIHVTRWVWNGRQRTATGTDARPGA